MHKFTCKGTLSVLFGAHQFLIHPLLVALAWTRLYGPPLSLPLWAAFFLHDVGYLGCADIDGEQGERHPELGARLMARLFGPEWGEFTLLHSRSYAKRLGKPVSALCHADKLAFGIEARALYLPRVVLTGEVREYLARAGGQPGSKYGSTGPDLSGSGWARLTAWHAWATRHSRLSAESAFAPRYT